MEKMFQVIRCDKLNKKSQTILKKDYMKSQINTFKYNFCERCGRGTIILDLDHKIPVCIGGEQIDINNLQLLCKPCHHNKTRVDLLVYNVFLKLNLVESNYGKYFNWYVDRKEVLEIYNYFTRKYKERRIEKLSDSLIFETL